MTPELINGLHFLRPLWLLAVPLLWALCLWLARRQRQGTGWSSLIDPELLPSLLLDSGSEERRTAPWPWLALAWSLAALALAGPSWQQDASAGWRAPAAWVIVLDLSPSMAASDVSPNRATRARYAIDDLLGAAHDARVGLVAFSDEPYTVAPLTQDVATIRTLLPPLAPEVMPSAGDQLAPALDKAGELLTAGGKERRILLLSDGFNDPAAALTAAARLKGRGIKLDVVGIGTRNGAPLPKEGGGFVQDAKGQPVLSKLDADALQELARTAGGQYVEVAALPDLIARLQEQPATPDGAEAVAGVQVQHWLDGGFWLLPPVLLLAALLARRGWL